MYIIHIKCVCERERELCVVEMSFLYVKEKEISILYF